MSRLNGLGFAIFYYLKYHTDFIHFSYVFIYIANVSM